MLSLYRNEPGDCRDGSDTEQYRWSSYSWHGLGRPNPLISEHYLYDQLGKTEEIRQHAYRELFRMQIPDEDIHVINESLDYNYPLGNERFREQIERGLGRAVGQRKRGRPSGLAKTG